MFHWLFELSETSPVAYALGMLALVCAVGMAVGSVKIKGIGLGSAGVLFMGMVIAQFTAPLENHTLNFVKEFGLALFVFTIGLQLGPGFFASLRAEGKKLNVLAGILVVLAGGLAPLLGAMFGMDWAAVAGLFAGASTNTPALGAVQQSLAAMPNIEAERLALPALACAVAYPGAIAGLLGTLVFLKVIFRIDPALEAEADAAARRKSSEPLVRRTLQLDRSRLEGLSLAEIDTVIGDGIVISRVRHRGSSDVRPATKTTRVGIGDSLLLVGTQRRLDEVERLIGQRSDEDLVAAPGDIAFQRIVVTNKAVLGKSLAELALEAQFGVEATRLARGDVEVTATANAHLKFGDVLSVVGPPAQLPKVAELLGNSLHSLNETQFVPLFAGICVGVIVGSVPIMLPGFPVPLRLGLAGGPLIVALLFGRIGHLGPLVWHMPLTANHAFREFGVALFFASLGLAAGDQFFTAVLSLRGVIWLSTGFVITVIPLVIVGIWARAVEKMNFATLGGMLAGGMTNPPALTFVNNLCRSEAAALAYATVYPLTTLLRIVIAQLLVLLFCR